MSSLIMIYASMTGNTGEMAEAIAEGVRSSGLDLVEKEVMDASAADLEAYDGILLGAYTWGDGELPDVFLDLYEDMDQLDLAGKKVAVFGSCDSAYEHVGAAVDLLIAKAAERGAEVVLEGLKVELAPTAAEKEKCRSFGEAFAKHFG
ncbi:flavodoxin [Brevibacillus migulae]|uniref:flavodoxin n=1 Tax=Brevibacillus migulae TaxID=1644114 RepID=UPI00106E1B9A|nr:flavodoxin [Brevibacillus migulae]